MSTQSSLFPPIYARWLEARFTAGPTKRQVTETLATCESCAMVEPAGLTRDPGPFLAHLKCCTYFPFIPNFGWGDLCAENNPETYVRMQQATAQGLLLPLGLYATPERQAKAYGHDFGQRTESLCPFFNTSALSCSIWTQRPGVCTTYFCKSDRGAVGLAFWADVEKYLNHFEWVMSLEIFSRLGLGENEIEMHKAVMSSEESEPEREYFIEYAWGDWVRRKDEFFRAARAEADRIGPTDLDGLLGVDYLRLEAQLRAQI